MQRKPNAILHMTAYGVVYGFLLAMLLIWMGLLLGANIGVEGERITSIFRLVTATSTIALLFGGLPGAILGLLEGWIIQKVLQIDSLPESINKHTLVVSINGILTTVGMCTSLLIILPSGSSDYFVVLLSIFSSLIAGGAAVYATRRYIRKLRAWGESFEKAKNKAKHPPKNKLDYEDDLSSKPLNLSGDEGQAQMEQD